MIDVEEFLKLHPVPSESKLQTKARRRHKGGSVGNKACNIDSGVDGTADGVAEDTADDMANDTPTAAVNGIVEDAVDDLFGEAELSEATNLSDTDVASETSERLENTEAEEVSHVVTVSGLTVDQENGFSKGPAAAHARHKLVESAKPAPNRDRVRKQRFGFGQGREQRELAEPGDVDACRESALRLLDASARSSGALRERLLDKGYEAQVVEQVIETLTRVQLLNDEEYAESVIRSCAARQYGERGTLTQLWRKGVDKQIAQGAVRQASDNGVFEDCAWELGRSVAQKTMGLDPAVRKRRFWSAAGRKGHNPETIRQVCEELF